MTQLNQREIDIIRTIVMLYDDTLGLYDLTEPDDIRYTSQGEPLIKVDDASNRWIVPPTHTECVQTLLHIERCNS